MINRRGQFTFIPWLVILFFVLAFYVLGVAPFLNDVTTDKIADNRMTGLEAFLFGGINVWVLFAVTLGVVVVIYYGVS